MTIGDSKLKEHVERVVSIATSVPEQLRLVCGLMDGFDFYSHVVGPDSAQAREALQMLVSEELRPALRQWYKVCGAEMNPAALHFRERLSDLVGERLG